MPPEVDPSSLTPQEISKSSKKELAQKILALHAQFAEQRKKLEKAKSHIRKQRKTRGQSANAGLIDAPPGRRSRDFNIFDMMNIKPKVVQVSKATYNNLISAVHLAVDSSNFNENVPFNKQDTEEVAKVIAYVKAQFPFLAKYKTAWPVKLLARQYMTNRRQYRRRVNASITEQGPPDEDPSTADPSAETTATNLAGDGDGGHNSSEDENLSDMFFSDVE